MSLSSTVDQRFILTKVDKVTLAFPANLVTETLLVERARVLTLPFLRCRDRGLFSCWGQSCAIGFTCSVPGYPNQFNARGSDCCLPRGVRRTPSRSRHSGRSNDRKSDGFADFRSPQPK